jgi:molybdate transport system regulatory protein
VGVPYRTAWYKIKDMEENLGVRLLTTQSGGADGGHSELTPEAHDLLARFSRITSGISELVQARFQSELEELLG